MVQQTDGSNIAEQVIQHPFHFFVIHQFSLHLLSIQHHAGLVIHAHVAHTLSLYHAIVSSQRIGL
jgi:hypothetical protein